MSLNVLIVDDKQIAAKSLKNILEGPLYGYVVEWARCYNEAIDALNGRPQPQMLSKDNYSGSYDIAVVDGDFPIDNTDKPLELLGVELITVMLSMPQFADTKIILSTSNAQIIVNKYVQENHPEIMGKFYYADKTDPVSIFDLLPYQNQ